MPKRKVIKINEKKCNGCAKCIPNCPEGAIQIIDKKARLVSDLFCDGLGACIGYCPQGAITIEERDAEPYDERKVMANIVKQGRNVLKAHLLHLKEHGQREYLDTAFDYLKENNIEFSPEESDACLRDQASAHSACPGSKVMRMTRKYAATGKTGKAKEGSALQNWPIQLMLVPVSAPYLMDADLLIAADCVPFAYPDFNKDLLEGKVLLVGCPKLDNLTVYQEKISLILEKNTVRSVTYAHMEVPCCFGLVNLIKSAIIASAKEVPFNEVIIGIKGERLK